MIQHAVLVKPNGIASKLGFKSFMLDGYKGPMSVITGDHTVHKYSPEHFRELYPYHRKSAIPRIGITTNAP